MTIRTFFAAAALLLLAASDSVAQSEPSLDLEARLKRLELLVSRLSGQVAALNKQIAEKNANNQVADASGDIKVPTPKLAFKSSEEYTVRGNTFTRYQLTVENHAQIPNELFRAAPDLPPCGRNKNSSRTWVNIHSSEGRRLYGFCAFNSNRNLTQLWFAVRKGSAPPAKVHIVLNDRLTKVKHKSNAVSINAEK